jgi:hypothetical protein
MKEKILNCIKFSIDRKSKSFFKDHLKPFLLNLKKILAIKWPMSITKMLRYGYRAFKPTALYSLNIMLIILLSALWSDLRLNETELTSSVSTNHIYDLAEVVQMEMAETFDATVDCTYDPKILVIGDGSCDYPPGSQVYKLDEAFEESGSKIVYIKVCGYACCGTVLVNPKAGPACDLLEIAGPRGPAISVTEIGYVTDGICWTNTCAGPDQVMTTCTGGIESRVTFLGSSDAGDGCSYWYYNFESQVDCGLAISHVAFALNDFSECCPCTDIELDGPDEKDYGCQTTFDLDAAIQDLIDNGEVYATPIGDGCSANDIVYEKGTITGDECGYEIVVTYSVEAECGGFDATHEVVFKWKSPAMVDVTCPSNVNASVCDYADQAALTAAYNAWLAGFTVSEDGCGATGSFDVAPPLAIDYCTGDTISATYRASDNCTEDSCTATFAVSAPAMVDVTCPSNVNASVCDYADQAALTAAYDAWLAGFTVSEDGCGATGSFDAAPPSSIDYCTGDTITVTYRARDGCTEDSCTATFAVSAPAKVDVTCPSNVNASVCDYADQAALTAAYDAWLAGFTVSEDGCGATGSFDAAPPSSIDYCTGDTITVTYRATDGCTEDSCTATFAVSAPAMVDVSCPSNVNASVCDYADQAALTAAYDAWLAGFTVSEDGCGATGSFDAAPPSSIDYCTGDTITVTYRATDGCTEDSCTATFAVSAPAMVDVSCPSNVNGSVCDYADQAALTAAYDAWLAGFSVSEDGCGATGSFDVAPPLSIDYCTGDTITVTYRATGCTEDSCTATFAVSAPAMVDVTCPSNVNGSVCDYADQAALTAAYDAWLAGFSVSEDGCGATGSFDVAPPLSIDYCTGDTITVTYRARDVCTEDSCTATFAVSIDETRLTLTCPTPDPTIVEEDNQATVDAAFETWKSGFTYSGGCNPVRKFYINDIEIDLDTLSAPSHCGGDVTVKMVVTSDCARDSCESEFITVATAQAIIVALPGMLTECFTEENPPTADDVPLRALEQILAAYATTTDCVDPNEIEMQTMVSGPEINGNEYTFTRTYSLFTPDVMADPAMEMITFFWDPNAPTLSGLPEDLALPCGSELPEWPVVSAYDVEFGEVTVIASSSQVGTSCGEKVQRTWTAYDGCGNSVTGVQTITFYDNEPPVLIVPADRVIHCGNAIPEPVYQASDNCSAFFVEYQEKITTHNECEYTITRIWIARDACYNFSRDTQIIDIIDTVPPVIEVINPMIAGIPNGGEMSIFGCIMDPAFLMTDVDVYDECCTATYSTSDRLIASGVCDIFGYYRKWKCTAIATDPAGNVSEFYFYVLQYDTSAPVIYNVPADLDLECGAEIPAPDTTVYVEDDCSLVSSPLFSEEVITDPEDSSKVLYIRTWWAEDYCGNRAEATQIIRVCAFDTVMASSAIGNTVWEDLNANGMQDPGEPGINGIKVYLYQSDPAAFNTMKVVASTVTATIEGQKGQFCFDHLPADRYQLQFEIPASMQFTTMKAGQDDELDSDVDPATGMTALINLHQQQRMNNIDAGLITRQSNTLFVELADFSVRSESCSHTISWITSSETDLLASFVIEYSADGNSFSEVQKVAPRGDFDKRTNYSFTDPVKRSKGHYRLTMIDVSGSEIHSDWKRVSGRCIDDRNFTVFPNPFREIFQIEFTSPRTGDAEILIFDRLGKLIQNTSVQTNQGFNREDVDLKQLPVGTYMVQIRMDDWTDHKLIIKTR